ncbi:UNVERIFIED_CONTAM: hypothetical protein Sradi_6801900 [Sesamum radiatum]|uniref:DUF4283 domain-containing protein n=1 Tax=Sesamum radiatum TaxID=300843 RepID=A0AAW2JTM9_SESRA
MAKKKKAKTPATFAGCTGRAADQQPTAPTSVNAVTDCQLSHATLPAATMAKGNKARLHAETAGRTPTGPVRPAKAIARISTVSALLAKAIATVKAPTIVTSHSSSQRKPPSTAMLGLETVKTNDLLQGNTKTDPPDFQAFISDMDVSPSLAVKDAGHAGITSNTTSHRLEAPLLGNESKSDVIAVKQTSFAGLFSNNRKLTNDNKLMKFEVGGETLKLETNDLIDVRAKLGHCLIGYIAGKFPRLKAIRVLSQSWGASFQLHDSRWLIFRFAKDEDWQRILAGGPYFVYGRPLLFKNMSGCFEFKEDDISLTPVWATLPSLPLECWHPNALGKVGSRLGTHIAMDSLTMKMKRVSYARILIKVDASKKLVDYVEFILPNGVVRKQLIVYEFTPKFCSTCNRFGHLKESCQLPATPTGTATATVARNATDAVIKMATLKKAQSTEWTVVQHRQRNNLKQQQPTKVVQQTDATLMTGSIKQSQTAEQQPILAAVPMIRRPAVVETDSEAGSSGSSNVPDSPTSTQHLIPGAKASIPAPNDPKQKQHLGGDSPPPSL